MPAAGLTLSLSYAYLDVPTTTQYDPFSDQNIRIYGVLSPRHTAALSGEYEFEPSRLGTLRAYVGMKYSGRQNFAGTEYAPAPGYRLWDARLTLSDIPIGSSRSGLKLSLWGKNLADEEHIVYTMTALDSPPLIQSQIAIYGTPRTFGLDVTYQY